MRSARAGLTDPEKIFSFLTPAGVSIFKILSKKTSCRVSWLPDLDSNQVTPSGNNLVTVHQHSGGRPRRTRSADAASSKRAKTVAPLPDMRTAGAPASRRRAARAATSGWRAKTAPSSPLKSHAAKADALPTQCGELKILQENAGEVKTALVSR